MANGGTESGMHAKMITSVDQQKVTHIRQILAWSVFMPDIITLLKTGFFARPVPNKEGV